MVKGEILGITIIGIYDYLYETYSKEDISNINQGVVNIIKQIANNPNINIEDIEV